MKKLSSEVQDAKFTFHKFVGIGAGELGMTPCEACGALERDPVHADKFRVSEAAPERIWIAPPGFKSYSLHFWYEQPPPAGNKAFGKLVEYARVHQPPEQNLEDKNSVSPKPTTLSHSSVVVSGDSSLDADQWQPIETAPRDSSWILAVMRTGRQTVIRWGGGAWEDDNRLCRDPTYWMPLPDPPLQITGARE